MWSGGDYSVNCRRIMRLCIRLNAHGRRLVWGVFRSDTYLPNMLIQVILFSQQIWFLFGVTVCVCARWYEREYVCVSLTHFVHLNTLIQSRTFSSCDQLLCWAGYLFVVVHTTFLWITEYYAPFVLKLFSLNLSVCAWLNWSVKRNSHNLFAVFFWALCVDAKTLILSHLDQWIIRLRIDAMAFGFRFGWISALCVRTHGTVSTLVLNTSIHRIHSHILSPTFCTTHSRHIPLFIPLFTI